MPHKFASAFYKKSNIKYQKSKIQIKNQIYILKIKNLPFSLQGQDACMYELSVLRKEQV
jgi:hypothetical protein